jgi:hypothetical protein
MPLWTSIPLAARAAEGFGWKGWPFSGFGYEGGFWPVVMRFLFVALLLGGIALFLRYLFGPKGRFRGKGWETIQEAKQREEREGAKTQGEEKSE